MATPEPGLDRHVWESELGSLEDDLRDDPETGLPLLADMIERMLAERGLSPADPVVDDGIDPEILATFRAAREVADLVDEGGAVDPGDVGHALGNLRAVFDYLIAERAPP
jgi:hypothetical protein